MTQSNTENRSQLSSSFPVHSLFTDFRSAIAAGFTVALLACPLGTRAQDPAATPDAVAQPPAATAPADTNPKATVTLSNQKPEKTRKKDEKVVQTKDTKQEVKKTAKTATLEGIDVKLPDKALYDKAEDAVKHGRFDVARLDLQTLLNTYPDSQFQMRAKLAIADSWYKEGGTAALTQAEQEYKDFITFFPNAPEAAEAQMRVGDIYFRQMDKPDRDPAKTVQAEQEYRLMIQQFPDSPLVPQATQRLREVQETLADREANIGAFYAQKTPPNLFGAIARYQTVVDTYPLYSHLDDVLIGLGDAYEAEAKAVRMTNLREDIKARLLHVYDDEAYAAYSKVVLEHSAAPHVEDARDRIVGMGLPVPTPTKDQMDASVALENSRGQYTLSKRAVALFMHSADTVPAATVGAPPLEDAKPTLAPNVYHHAIDAYTAAINPANAPRVSPAAAPAAAGDPATPAAATTNAPAAAPLSLQDVPAAAGNTGGGASAVITSVPSTSSAGTSGGNSIGAEIVQPQPGSAPQAPVTPPAAPPSFPGDTAAPATTPATPPASSTVPPPDPNGGLKAVGPTNTTALPPVEKAAQAPDPVNEAAGTTQPAAQTPPANGKKPKPAMDKADESSSKHKPKKGLGKLNPF